MRVHEVRRTQNEYRCRLKAIWRALADDERENRRKLRTHHLQTLESSLDERKGAGITVSKLKIDLIKSYPELDGISDFCIRDALRNRLSYSFKKLEKAPKLSTESGRIRMLHESAKVMLSLLQRKVKTVLFDEC